MWLAIVADLGGIAWLMVSDAPSTLKFGVAGLQALGFYTIVVFYLGCRSQWARGPAVEDPPGAPTPH